MKGGACVSKSGKGNGWDRADLERMSTAELEELLLRDFHAPERVGEDMSGLYQAAQVLAEREPDGSAAANRAWEDFRENYLPFVESGGLCAEDGVPPSSDAAPGRRHSPLRRWGLRAAAAAAVVLLSVSATAAAGSRGLEGLLALWTDERMWLTPSQIVPVDRDELSIPEEPEDYASLQEALEDYGLSLQVVPRWLPEGFELDRLIVDDQTGVQMIFHAGYAREDNYLVVSVIIHLEEDMDVGSLTNFQKDEGDPAPYEAGGVTHMLATNAGRPAAVWANGPAECAISGDITMEELERMIDSIYQ